MQRRGPRSILPESFGSDYERGRATKLGYFIGRAFATHRERGAVHEVLVDLTKHGSLNNDATVTFVIRGSSGTA
jgi:hypothetical protein